MSSPSPIESFSHLNESLNSFLWGPYVLLPLLIVVGVYLGVRLGKGFFRGEAYRPPDE
jgi:Na+/alanine symporter